MRLTTATGYGTSELVTPLLVPGRATPRSVQASPCGGRDAKPLGTDAARPGVGTTPAASSLLALSAEARREGRNNAHALVVLWVAGWLALVLALTV